MISLNETCDARAVRRDRRLEMLRSIASSCLLRGYSVRLYRCRKSRASSPEAVGILLLYTGVTSFDVDTCFAHGPVWPDRPMASTQVNFKEEEKLFGQIQRERKTRRPKELIPHTYMTSNEATGKSLIAALNMICPYARIGETNDAMGLVTLRFSGIPMESRRIVHDLLAYSFSHESGGCVIFTESTSDHDGNAAATYSRRSIAVLETSKVTAGIATEIKSVLMAVRSA